MVGMHMLMKPASVVRVWWDTGHGKPLVVVLHGGLISPLVQLSHTVRL